MAKRGTKIFLGGVGVLGLAIILLVVFWNWDWFIPIVQSQASAALGRRVTLQHLHVRLGRITTVTADGVAIAEPDGFPADPPFASVRQLTVSANVMDYLRHRSIVLPLVSLDTPAISANALADGRNNWTFKLPGPAKPASKPTPPPQIGALRITDGTAHLVDPKLRTDASVKMHTEDGPGPAIAGVQVQDGRIIASAKGTYRGQRVVGHFDGGALLSLRDSTHPYPIDLHIENGDTHVSLLGTVRDPISFAGAALELKLSGSDMSGLYKLTGIPIPATPPYAIAGHLDYNTATKRIEFHQFTGHLGSSDLEGDIDEDPGIGGKPDVRMDLRSNRVDLTDLGGFIGTTPGRPKTPGQSPSEEHKQVVAEHKKSLLPDTPIDLPKLRAANIHLKYRAAHIENKFTPFDNLVVALDVVDGRITLHPLDFGVGHGDITSSIDLDPGKDNLVHARAHVRFQQIDIARLMQATHTFHGQGIIGGQMQIDTTGNSLAAMMGRGNGELKLILVHGGNLSALLDDLAGLEFGNALLSAIGVPNRATINCFVTDLQLQEGIAHTKALLLDTSEARTIGRGDIDFRDQTLDYSLTTRSRHFSIGSLPGPIDITGPLGSPSIRPGVEVAARAGAAVGLGILLTPIGALLPTIQFGIGKDQACAKAVTEEKEPIRVAAPGTSHAHAHHVRRQKHHN